MVISFDDENKNAKLSLRQTEILKKLSAIVDDICADCPESWVPCWTRRHSYIPIYPEFPYLPFIQNMDDTCWNRPQDRHIQVPSAICCQSKTTCVTGEFSAQVENVIWLTRCSRRNLARKHLKPNEVPITFTSFPHLGVAGQFTEPYFDPAGAVSSHSLFLPEEITNPHARFPSVLFYSMELVVITCRHY